MPAPQPTPIWIHVEFAQSSTTIPMEIIQHEDEPDEAFRKRAVAEFANSVVPNADNTYTG